jgi:hypothetical protein
MRAYAQRWRDPDGDGARRSAAITWDFARPRPGLLLDPSIPLLSVTGCAACADAALDQPGTKVLAVDGAPPDTPIMRPFAIQGAVDGRVCDEAHHLLPSPFPAGRAALVAVQAAQRTGTPLTTMVSPSLT